MSAEPELAELLADGTETVLLTQASTPIEAQLIRERIAASGGQGRPQVSLGAPGSPATGLPESLLEGDQAARLVPVRVAWLPEEHAGRRAARLADMMPGHDPYHPSERQQRQILSRQPDRATVLVGEPATVASLRQHWTETTGRPGPGRLRGLRGPPGHAGPRPSRVPAARSQVQDAEPGERGDPLLAAVPLRAAHEYARRGSRRGVGADRWPKRARSSTSSPRAGAAGSSTSCRPWGG